MQIHLISQGYGSESEHTLGSLLVELISEKAYGAFTAISAFASEGGVNGIAKHLSKAKDHLKKITIIVGVDQKGTSEEALKALLKIGVKVFIYYQKGNAIFHPKIYLFEGSNKSELILGSSNLTVQGLFSNVEASLWITLDVNDEDDIAVINQLKSNFSTLFDQTDVNLQPLTQELIEMLVKAGIVPAEKDRKQVQDKCDESQNTEMDQVITKFFPKKVISKIPSEFKVISKSVKVDVVEKFVEHKEFLEEVFIWKVKSLKIRDLNIPKGEKTNATGSMLFKKGELDIDPRSYFRDVVFANLKWKPDSEKPHYERAYADFKIVIDGTSYGVYNLKISHKTDTTSKSYFQHNSMTSLSWGPAKKIIAKDELIGKSLSLYKKGSIFVIRIE
ncbi:phospholipase D-like domain-containing protein [Parabacteroides faecis]|uniref:HKD family nuclease n=1 Tax=Parabacteroides faecis TaxID=1217282 RepID=A0ABR6KP79_9BACT|nr:phospholipase D family protein [Parabacteroides faecis]MBB4622648.1 HKD family nuclease [Parabacteroides faecis]GGK08990.1 hypothetical protein GCM10007084_35110 [Parabacteroides faecis]